MVDEVGCIVKVKDDCEVNDVVVLKVVDDAFDVVVDLDVGCLWNDVRVVGDACLLLNVNCQIAVVDRMMIEVVVDEVLELNDDDEHYKDDLVDEYANNIEDEDILDVSVNEVARKDVDENVDVDLDGLVKDDVVVFLDVSIEVIFEDDVAEKGKVDVVDILGDVVCKHVDCDVNDDTEDEATEDGGQVEVVTADGVCIVVVVMLLDTDAVEVDEADALVDAAIVVNLIAVTDDKLVH